MPELYDWLQTSAITPLIGQNRNMYSRQEPLNFNICMTNQKQERLNMKECTSRQGESAQADKEHLRPGNSPLTSLHNMQRSL